ISAKGWPQEAALRMLMNNLDPEVAERPQDLIVYGGTGKAARSWDAFDQIVRALRRLEGDETLLIQSGKPVGVFRTTPQSPRVLISNAMLVPTWADWETFWELERAGLTMYGQMTAGRWIYIGSAGRIRACRAIPRGGGGAASRRPRGVREAGLCLHGPPLRSHGRVPRCRRRGVRLREQPPSGSPGGRIRSSLRLPRVRSGIHPA